MSRHDLKGEQMTVQSSMKIAVFGLGSMGYGMAQSLLRAGHTVHGFDVVPQQVERFRDDGGAGGELADIAVSLDAVVVVVLNAGQTEDVLFGVLSKNGGTVRVTVRDDDLHLECECTGTSQQTAETV